MSMEHQILDASNNSLSVTNLFASNNPTTALGANPLGTSDGTATGELGTKVIMVGGVNPIGAGYSSQITITRPADTTAYTAGDVVGGALTFPLAGPAAGFINLNDADLRIDLTAVPSGMTSFRLHLYNLTPPSALADNIAWDLPSGDRASYLGYVDLGTPIDVGSTLFVQLSGIGYKQILLGASTSLFGYLVTNGAYTPTSAATASVRLNSRGL